MHFCNLNDCYDILENQENFRNVKIVDFAELRKLKLPLPITFILFYSSAKYYYQQHKYPKGFEEEFDFLLQHFEKDCNKRFNDPSQALLLNVCTDISGKVTGIGFTDQTLPVLIEKHGKINAYKQYIQFIQEFSTIVLQVPFVDFYSFVPGEHHSQQVEILATISEKDFLTYVHQYQEHISNTINKDFPQDPYEQLLSTLNRLMCNVCENIEENIFIEEIILPVHSEKSFEGFFYSRNPYTGSDELYGIYCQLDKKKYHISNIHQTQVETLENKFPCIYRKLNSYRTVLDEYYKEIMEITFVTKTHGNPYLTQIMKASRTPRASLKKHIDLYTTGVIDAKETIERIRPDEIEKLYHVSLQPESKKILNAFQHTGAPGAPGAAAGKLYLNIQDARTYFEEANKKGNHPSIILAIDDLKIDDHWIINMISGLITQTSGISSHGAVMARSKGIPCIVGFNEIYIDTKTKQFKLEEKVLHQGDDVTIEVIDKGYLYQGKGKLVSFCGEDDLMKTLQKLLIDFQKKEKIDFKVMVNINNAEDAVRGLSFGADGVGLCRTENFFISRDRLQLLRELIFSQNDDKKRRIYEEIYNFQIKDYYEIFKVVQDKPVVIRLMDIPLYEVMPGSKEEIDELKQILPNISEDDINATILSNQESNPILGLRGCRYALINESLYSIQISAMIMAAYQYQRKEDRLHLSILIPLVMNTKEFLILKQRIMEIEKGIRNHHHIPDDECLNLKVGAMIELPCAALSTGEMARYADFYSFGTNDLTQTTYGISRDDVGRFMPIYLEKHIFEYDPFYRLGDEVCELIELAVQRGRQVRPDMMFSICGEQGGASESLLFALRTKIDSVSVSPYRILPTRLRLIHQYFKDQREQTQRNKDKRIVSSHYSRI